jgi:CheY-like chemotaxis protein
VAVRSAPGRGSAFSIELERAFAAPQPATAAPAAHPALSGTNVVLVDDDAEIRRSMRRLLESWGCRYVAAASAAEVEAKLGAQGLKPHALIVDYRLADAVTGLQVIERLRATYGRELPALLITGTPSAALREQLGDTPLAVKPVLPGRLRAFLAQATRRKA